MASSSKALAVIAEAMLDVGWLQSRDWNCDLASSVRMGLGRYAAKYVWKVLALRLFIADNIADPKCEMPGCDWYAVVGETDTLQAVSHHDTPPWGMVALLHNPYDVWPHVQLGERCMQLDTFVKGAGTTIFNLVSFALALTIGGFTPMSAHWWWSTEWVHRCEWVSELEAEQETDETDPEHVLTDSMNEYLYEEAHLDGFPDPDALRELFPKALFRKRIARRILRSTKERLPSDAPLVLQKAVRHAIELLVAFDALTAFREQHRAHIEKYEPRLMAEPVLPVGVMWEEDDAVGRMSDEYLEKLNGTENTEVCCAGCFDPSDRNSLALTFQEMELVLRVLQPLDKVLHYLHGRVPREERVQNRPLLEVLGEDDIRTITEDVICL